MKTLLPRIIFSLAVLSCSLQGYTQDKTADDGKVAEAITKVSVYFSNVGTQVGRNDIEMFLFLLKEHFHCELNIPSLEEFKKINPELNATYLMLYDVYFDGKSAPEQPDSVVRKYLKDNLYEIDGLTVWSMFCRKYPLPANYLKILRENAAMGNFELTHAGYQLANVMRLGCMKPTEETESLKEDIAQKLVLQIGSEEKTKYSDEIKYQAIGVLYYLGRADLVKQQYIDMLVHNQNADGGWGLSLDEAPGSDVHASAMALWALLEYQSRLKK